MNFTMAGMLGALESIWRNLGLLEIGHRIVARLEEQQDVLAICGPVSAETHCASADARAQCTTVSGVEVRARENGRLLQVITDLAAMTIP